MSYIGSMSNKSIKYNGKIQYSEFKDLRFRFYWFLQDDKMKQKSSSENMCGDKHPYINNILSN